MGHHAAESAGCFGNPRRAEAPHPVRLMNKGELAGMGGVRSSARYAGKDNVKDTSTKP